MFFGGEGVRCIGIAGFEVNIVGYDIWVIMALFRGWFSLSKWFAAGE
mgnify:CR=1 FL=1